MLNIDNTNLTRTRLYECSKRIKGLVEKRKYEECRKIICQLLGQYPDSAEPQNLYGLLLEAQSRHGDAMKHFRAAWALDATYVPAKINLEYFGTFEAEGHMAYNEDDCPAERADDFGTARGCGGNGYPTEKMRA